MAEGPESDGCRPQPAKSTGTTSKTTKKGINACGMAPRPLVEAGCLDSPLSFPEELLFLRPHVARLRILLPRSSERRFLDPHRLAEAKRLVWPLLAWLFNDTRPAKRTGYPREWVQIVKPSAHRPPRTARRLPTIECINPVCYTPFRSGVGVRPATTPQPKRRRKNEHATLQ